MKRKSCKACPGPRSGMPEIITALNDDGSRAIVKCGKHYAMFKTARDRKRGLLLAAERAQEHVKELKRTYKPGYKPPRARKPARYSNWKLDAREKRRLNESAAVDYAIWLAKRDNIELPKDACGRAQFACADFGETPRSVKFGAVEIKIPNWDWAPADPVEETMWDWAEAA